MQNTRDFLIYCLYSKSTFFSSWGTGEIKIDEEPREQKSSQRRLDSVLLGMPNILSSYNNSDIISLYVQQAYICFVPTLLHITMLHIPCLLGLLIAANQFVLYHIIANDGWRGEKGKKNPVINQVSASYILLFQMCCCL